MKATISKLKVTSRIVAWAHDELSTFLATAHYEEGYIGRVCVLNLVEIIGVLPCPQEAIKVAAFAITAKAGFGNVSLLVAENEMTTHNNFTEWLNSNER